MNPFEFGTYCNRRAAEVQISLLIGTVSHEPSVIAPTEWKRHGFQPNIRHVAWLDTAVHARLKNGFMRTKMSPDLY